MNTEQESRGEDGEERGQMSTEMRGGEGRCVPVEEVTCCSEQL